MKTKIKIPKGWRRLGAFKIINDGDKCLNGYGEWFETKCEGWTTSQGSIYIRRIKRKAAK